MRNINQLLDRRSQLQHWGTWVSYFMNCPQSSDDHTSKPFENTLQGLTLSYGGPIQPYPRDILDAKGPLCSPYDFVDPITWNGGPSRDNDAILKTMGLPPLKKRRKKRKVYHSLADVEGDPDAVDDDKSSTNRKKKHVKVSSDTHDEGLKFERPPLSKKKKDGKKKIITTTNCTTSDDNSDNRKSSTAVGYLQLSYHYLHGIYL